MRPLGEVLFWGLEAPSPKRIAGFEKKAESGPLGPPGSSRRRESLPGGFQPSESPLLGAEARLGSAFSLCCAPPRREPWLDSSGLSNGERLARDAASASNESLGKARGKSGARPWKAPAKGFSGAAQPGKKRGRPDRQAPAFGGLRYLGGPALGPEAEKGEASPPTQRPGMSSPPGPGA